jgi:hypothetical protein
MRTCIEVLRSWEVQVKRTALTLVAVLLAYGALPSSVLALSYTKELLRGHGGE